MPTDVNWTWTILMADGQVYHVHEPLNIYELLERFTNAGHWDTEIEAIIRH